ncbi:GlxA family transcriptional regulator [Streptomyces lavendulae]|uniref:HTH-type transcriptional regulator CdhR n=1 Tax=Streptomyces lavendulae subsp. lavendulae TaxID=58340 RepID=A0A2K8P9V2_STRLA|nr:helix-turn-helix domain-containing protein [Streptomyces lavendulae]ATZ23517.1 HTH-type transcriptional regulator CdhR [Streptomyces lavendulae subsp. lavendulae]QUQ53348.1 HTH-type transcriptional regulator CdhR [Streptomyces lavendulae subsp. lavendulae]
MHRVAIVAQPGIRSFDLAVITEVWGPDRARVGVPPFELRRCALRTGPIELPGGLTLTPDRGLDWLSAADLVVVPALAEPADPTPEPVLAALRAAHARGVPVAALCAGAFVLAEAGLLDGRRAVTHWWLAPQLAARYPAVLVEEAPLFVEDDGLWTSAGVASGIDLCLHLVREAHGSEAAAAIARSMVTGPFRTGDHAQYLDRPTPSADRTAEALAAVRERALRRLHEPLDVATLARWAGMSPRSFARHFAAATGTTPHKWLLRHRLDEARKLLERTDHPVPEVARRAGFASEVTFRQHFGAHVGLSPRAYRAAAAATSAASAAAPPGGDSVRNGS